MTLDLREKAFAGDGHQACAAEAGHVAEDVGGIESLLVDFHIECVHQFQGDVVHDLGGEIVVEKKSAVTFESALAHIGARFDIESELNIGAKEVGFKSLLVGPVEILLKKEQTRDGIEFLGGPAHDGMKVFAELSDGHEAEEQRAKDALPTFGDSAQADRAEEPFKGVKEALL